MSHPHPKPEIIIKAGRCNQDGTTVIPVEQPGLLYIYRDPDDEGLHHFCWKARTATEPEDDLLMIPGDAQLVKVESQTGRIVVLKFSSSSQRQFYWLQSKSEDSNNPAFWSERDNGWIRRINSILQQDDGDEDMGDAPIDSSEIENEGEAPRRGGEDGGRADPAPFNLASLISQIKVPDGLGTGAPRPPGIFLHDLLTAETTTPLVEELSERSIENLISNLPPALVPKDASLAQKKQIIAKVLRSPQFTQGAASLSVALREGALKGVADSLKIPLLAAEEISNADPVEIFIKAIKRQVERDGGN